MNELVENAAKFSKQKSSSIRVQLKHFINLLSIEVTNETSIKLGESFKDYIKKITNVDHEKLYFEKLESKTENDTTSGMGLLMLLKDYPTHLGVQFKKDKNENEEFYTIHAKIILKLEE